MLSYGFPCIFPLLCAASLASQALATSCAHCLGTCSSIQPKETIETSQVFLWKVLGSARARETCRKLRPLPPACGTNISKSHHANAQLMQVKILIQQCGNLISCLTKNHGVFLVMLFTKTSERSLISDTKRPQPNAHCSAPKKPQSLPSLR